MTPDLSITTARIEALIAAVEAHPDDEARRQAMELVRETMVLYGVGLERIVDIVRAHDATPLIEQLASDPAVATLFALHDLSPAPRATQPVPPKPLVQIARRKAAGDHAAGGRCERCGAALDAMHRHYVDLAQRRLQCGCQECWDRIHAGGDDDLRAVPQHSATFPALQLSEAQWDALQIPVGLAFFVVNSRANRTFAFYPSPAGAVESLLSLEAWNDLTAANPWIAHVTPDVEAVLVRKSDGVHRCESAVLPIDACYDLIGRIRLHWKGFTGGDGVQLEIGRTFSEVAQA